MTADRKARLFSEGSDAKGGHSDGSPQDLRVRQFPAPA